MGDEVGWTCTTNSTETPASNCNETCGDGLVIGLEDCDDGVNGNLTYCNEGC